MRNPAFLVTHVYCKYQFKQPWTKVHIPAVCNIYKGTPPIGIDSHIYKILTIGDYAKTFDVSYMVWQMSRYQSATNSPNKFKNSTTQIFSLFSFSILV